VRNTALFRKFLEWHVFSVCLSFWLLLSLDTHKKKEKPSHHTLLRERGSVFFARKTTDIAGNSLEGSPASILEQYRLMSALLISCSELKESCWWFTQVWHNFFSCFSLKIVSPASVQFLTDPCYNLIFFIYKLKPKVTAIDCYSKLSISKRRGHWWGILTHVHVLSQDSFVN